MDFAEGAIRYDIMISELLLQCTNDVGSNFSKGKTKSCSGKYITLILLCLMFGRLYKNTKYPMHSGILSGSGGVDTLKGCHLPKTILCMYLFDIFYRDQ